MALLPTKITPLINQLGGAPGLQGLLRAVQDVDRSALRRGFVVYKLGTQNITQNVTTAVTFANPADYTEGGGYDKTNSRFIVPGTGKAATLWLLGSAMLSSNMTAAVAIMLRISKNDSAITQVQGPAVAGQNVANVITAARLVPGDIITVEILHTDVAPRDFGDSTMSNFWAMELA